MHDITYRPYQENDAPDIKRIVDEAFHIHRYTKKKHLLHSALEIYLRECLLASTHTQVADQDGRVIGVLMGRLPEHPRLPQYLRNKLLTWAHMATILTTGFTELPSLAQHFKFEKAYRKLRQNTSAPLTDELTLFAVDASTRGTGIGKTLYQNYMRHLKENGRTDFYLYTDSLCTYGFYENRGMTRAAAQNIKIRLDGEPEDIGVYLYTGRAH